MSDVEELLQLASGSMFRRCDFHVHTPASADTAERWRDATPEELVALALDRRLDVIAITDHNTTAWCDRARDAARDTALLVFPGVEISTSEGHLLAVFDRDERVSEINELLIRVGIGEDGFGDLHAIADKNIADVAERVESLGGLAIAAHVDREKGFWTMSERSPARRTQIHACVALRAFEVADPANCDPAIAGGVSGYPRRVPFVQGSDTYHASGSQHDLDAIGRRHCFLSMDDVSVSAMRQVLLDPEIGLRLMGEERRRPNAVIEGVMVSDGFLGGQRLRFNDNITCLIGGTGSGKSLTLELIRYTLDQGVDQGVLPRVAEDVERLLDFALDDGATVSVVLRMESSRYVVERAWVAGMPPGPTVTRLDDTVAAPPDRPIHVPSFFPIKGFSQGEIIEYAREPLARLSLLDDLIDLSDERSAIVDAKAALRRNTSDLLAKERELATAIEETRELPGVTEQVEQMAGLVDLPEVRQHEAWLAERAVVRTAQRSLTSLREGLGSRFPGLETPWRSEGDVGEETPSADLMEHVAALEAEVHRSLEDAHGTLRRRLDEVNDQLTELRAEWDARFATADVAYQEALQALVPEERGQAAIQVELNRLRERQRTLLATETRTQQVIRPEIAGLKEAREATLTALQTARRAIAAKRSAKAEELSETLGRRVLIRVKAESHSEAFRQQLLDLRTGSNLRETEIAVMAEELHPVPLVKSLIAQDFDAPAAASGISADHFRRLTQNIVERNRLADLYELQLADLEDTVRIQFAVDGDEYRDLERLAHGQKCTVVLMIALAEGDSPLLVDQPEDALHAPWIEDYIVSSLRNRRGSRQCLFATRSANVLVSADAEQVIALTADATHGSVERTGALDRFDTRSLVLYHVEGGEEAFRRRQAKYGL